MQTDSCALQWNKLNWGLAAHLEKAVIWSCGCARPPDPHFLPSRTWASGPAHPGFNLCRGHTVHTHGPADLCNIHVQQTHTDMLRGKLGITVNNMLRWGRGEWRKPLNFLNWQFTYSCLLLDYSSATIISKIQECRLMDSAIKLVCWVNRFSWTSWT